MKRRRRRLDCLGFWMVGKCRGSGNGEGNRIAERGVTKERKWDKEVGVVIGIKGEGVWDGLEIGMVIAMLNPTNGSMGWF
jgi:hypothetical protein